MPADLLSRLAAHVAATRDAPSPADQLIAEALEAICDDGWQPIECAPKQRGARFDVWCVLNPERPCAPVGRIAGVRIASDGGLAYLNGNLWCKLDSIATHYRPLPSPPERDDG